MNIVGIVGSMRKNRLTDTLVRRVVAGIEERCGPAVSQIVYTGDLDIRACRVACCSYCTKHPYRCSIADDLSGVLQRMNEADAIIVGTPLYFRAPPAGFQAFAERLISMFFFQESRGSERPVSPLHGKPCGLIGVAQYSNPQMILEYLHDFCTVLSMHPVPLERFPYLGVGAHGDFEEDTIFHPLQRADQLAEAIGARLQISS